MMSKLKDFILSNKVFSKCSEQEQEAILSELERVEVIEKAYEKAIKKITVDNDEGFDFLDSQYEYWYKKMLED